MEEPEDAGELVRIESKPAGWPPVRSAQCSVTVFTVVWSVGTVTVVRGPWHASSDVAASAAVTQVPQVAFSVAVSLSARPIVNPIALSGPTLPLMVNEMPFHCDTSSVQPPLAAAVQFQ